jgi:hypothetical protein
MTLLFNSLGQYSSSLYEIARGVLRSRQNQASKAERLAEELESSETERLRVTQDLQSRGDELERTRQQLYSAQRELQELGDNPITLPTDPPVLHHCYGPKMISLCLTLAKKLGFRPTEAALNVVLRWFGITSQVPSWESIRGWACRVGVAELQSTVPPADDWIWMADHSNQIGQEKVLKVIGIRASDLPPPGETLRVESMRVLAVVPGTEWKREDVRREYKKLAERIGSPRYLLTDGAVELFESADTLGKPGKEVVHLRDMKHFAANALERHIGKSERFKDYLSRLGRTRSSVQQTELGHFVPPPVKPKARFMNLASVLRWGEMVSFHLTHYHSEARKDIAADRMNDKLGWVRGFREDLACWRRCQDVMSASLSFINRSGLSQGTSKAFEAMLEELRTEESQNCETSDSLARELIAFVDDSEALLKEGERAWLSTEPLESSFGLFKRLEGQHSKGGFTSLVAAMPIMLTDCTVEFVRKSLLEVSTKQMKAWVTENLGTTLTAKRSTAYREFSALSPG